MRIICVLMIFLIINGCAIKVSTKITSPARYQEATSLRKVAVLDIEGDFGKRVTSAMENVLTNATISENPYFTVIDRQNLDKILSEQNFQSSGLIDESSMVKFGKIIGAEGIYTGIANMSYDDSNFTENRTKCTRTNKKGKCTNWSDYKVVCIKRTLMLSIIPKLINVSAGNVVYTNLIEKSVSDSRCSDSSSALLSSEELLSKALKYAMSQFRKDVAPYETKVLIKVLENNDGISDEEGKKLLKSSLEFAKNDRIDRACKLWEHGILKSPMSVAFNYNYGICLEIDEDLENALLYYKKADRLSLKPIKQINEALIRIQNLIKNREKLKKQL